MNVLVDSPRNFFTFYLYLGTCAGASAIAWALSLPEDGEVITMDIEQEAYVKYGKQLLSKRRDIDEKIDFRLGDAIDTLGE